MRTNIVRIRLRREPFHVLQNSVHVLLQCVEGVLKVLIVISLLGTLIVRLAHYIELFGGCLIILLEDVVEEDVPDLGRNLSALRLK